MPVPVVWPPASELHEPGPGHPEQPDRIRAVLAALRAPDLVSRVVWSEARPAGRAAIERVHPAPYVAALEQLAARGGGALDPDTYLGSRSFAAALAAAAVAMGAVERALGAGGGGTAFRVPRPPGLPRATYVLDLLAAVDAALDGWKPDVLLISAGFYSLAGDPLGGFTLEPDDVAAWTTALRERVAPAPVVGVLEGGYRLDLLAAGVRAHVRALARPEGRADTSD